MQPIQASGDQHELWVAIIPAESRNRPGMAVKFLEFLGFQPEAWTAWAVKWEWMKSMYRVPELLCFYLCFNVSPSIHWGHAMISRTGIRRSSSALHGKYNLVLVVTHWLNWREMGVKRTAYSAPSFHSDWLISPARPPIHSPNFNCLTWEEPLAFIWFIWFYFPSLEPCRTPKMTMKYFSLSSKRLSVSPGQKPWRKKESGYYASIASFGIQYVAPIRQPKQARSIYQNNTTLKMRDGEL